jgi:hypothetical protein
VNVKIHLAEKMHFHLIFHIYWQNRVKHHTENNGIIRYSISKAFWKSNWWHIYFTIEVNRNCQLYFTFLIRFGNKTKIGTESLYFHPPIRLRTNYALVTSWHYPWELNWFVELHFTVLKYLKILILWRLFYIYKFKCIFPVTFYIFLSANQRRLYSFTPVVCP